MIIIIVRGIFVVVHVTLPFIPTRRGVRVLVSVLVLSQFIGDIVCMRVRARVGVVLRSLNLTIIVGIASSDEESRTGEE